MNLFAEILAAGWTVVFPSFAGDAVLIREEVNLCPGIEISEPASIPVPLGCRHSGPGCVDGSSVRLRVKFKSHPAVRSARLYFADATGAPLRVGRSTSRNASPNSDGSFTLEAGRALVRDLPLNASDPVFAWIQPSFNSPMSGTQAEFTVVFEQYLDGGRKPMNTVDGRFHFAPCSVVVDSPPPTTSLAPPSRDSDGIEVIGNGEENPVIILRDHHGRQRLGWRFWKNCSNDILDKTERYIDIEEDLQPPTSCNTEVAVLSSQHRFELDENVEWQQGQFKTHPVRLHDPLTVDLNFWLDRRQWDQEVEEAQSMLLEANQLYASNRAGVQFRMVKRALPVAFEPKRCRDFRAPFPSPAIRAAAEAAYIEHALNVYFIPGRGGASCPNRDVVLLGNRWAPKVQLAHEIGHAFGLNEDGCRSPLCSKDYAMGHVNGLGGFDKSNIMRRGGVDRTTFTIGQVYRMNVSQHSNLNKAGIRKGDTRNCPGKKKGAKCPKLSLD